MVGFGKVRARLQFRCKTAAMRKDNNSQFIIHETHIICVVMKLVRREMEENADGATIA